MKDLTILVSAANSPSMPGMLDCFRNNGERKIRIVGMDMCDEPSIRYLVDSFYVVPAATELEYCDVVLEICRKEKVDIYFPTISAEVSAISARKDDFEQLGVRLSISNESSISIANNKLKAYEMFKKVGIPLPNYLPIQSVDDYVSGCKQMGFPERPVCIKIVNNSGSRGVRIIDSKRNRYQIFAHEKPNSFFTSYEDMLSVLNSADFLEEMMLVEYMPGNEYTVDLLADKGEVLYEVGRENIVSLMSIAQESVLAYDEHAYSICRDIVKLLNLDGNIGFDFMRAADGTAMLMDINPRITATVSVIAAGGINLPYLRIKQLLGEEMPVCKPIYGTRLKRRYGELYTGPSGERVFIKKME